MSVSLSVVSDGSCSTNTRSMAVDVADSTRRKVRKVQCIFPPMVYPKFQSRQTALFPLGLGYVAAVLEQRGYEVSLIDCPSEGYDTHIDIGKDRYIYGLKPEEVRKRIEDFKPDAVALSCLFSTLETRMVILAHLVKEIDPNIVVICGGPHVSAFHDRLMHDPAIDYCVLGEGEEVIVQLLDAMNALRSLDTVPALCRRENGSIIEQARDGYIEDLSSLPFPARHLVDMETYFKIAEPQGLRLDGERNVRQAQMTTSRGCPFMCTYCGKNVTWGKSYRTRTSGEVVAEMEHLMTSFGVERFAFQDDNFTADMERAGDICDKIVERNLNITFECPNGLGVNFLSPSLLEKMKAAGCVSFTIAVESANDVTLRRVKKPNYIKLAPPIVQKAKELDIEVRGFFMIGFPGENIDEVNRTVEYARNLDLAVTNFAIVTPLPGTPLYTECVQAGLINETTVDFEDFAYGAFDIKLSEVSVEELKMVRKIEWMRTMFLDRNGEFRGDIRLKRKDVIDELTKGLSVFPENPEMICMHHKAMEFYGSTSIEEAAAVT